MFTNLNPVSGPSYNHLKSAEWAVTHQVIPIATANVNCEIYHSLINVKSFIGNLQALPSFILPTTPPTQLIKAGTILLDLTSRINDMSVHPPPLPLGTPSGRETPLIDSYPPERPDWTPDSDINAGSPTEQVIFTRAWNSRARAPARTPSASIMALSVSGPV